MPSVAWKNILYKGILPFWGYQNKSAPFSSTHCAQTSHVLHKLFIKNHTIGGNVLTFEKDCVTGISTFGYQKLPSCAVTDKTFFRCASVSKLVLSIGALTMVDKGLIGLHEDIRLYFTFLFGCKAHSTKPITLYHLLSHTSSIIDGPLYFKSLTSPISLEELLSSPSSFSLSAPGAAFCYSNLAFGLIGSLIEILSGHSLQTYMEENLFSPMNMNCTFNINTIPKNLGPATTYQVISKAFKTPALAFNADKKRETFIDAINVPNPSYHYQQGAGGLYSDVQSLSKVLSLLYKEGAPILKKETFFSMISANTPYGLNKPTFFQGLGLVKIQDSTLIPHPIWGHQGFAYGVAQGVFYNPTTQKGLVSLNNGCSLYRQNNIVSLSWDLIRFLLT